MKAVLSQRGFDADTMADTYDNKINRSSTSCKVTINEMLENNMKNYFNKMRPKFGMKNYEIKDNMHREPYYKIDKIAISKKDKADGVFDQYVKMKSFVPPAKYDMAIDWTKNFDKRGKFLKGDKISYISSILMEGKKRPSPAPTSYNHKEYIGKNISTNRKDSTSEKICGFIEQAKWQGIQTAKINHTSSYSVTDVNSRPAKIWKESEKSNDKRLDKIVKDKTKPA